MVLQIILCILTCIPGARSPEENPRSIYVDLLEINHYYHEGTRHAYSQVIYWEEYRTGQYRVLAWRSVKQDYRIHRNHNLYTDAYINERGHVLYIRSKLYRESHTDYDPELLDAEVWPKEYRQFPELTRHKHGR